MQIKVFTVADNAFPFCCGFLIFLLFHSFSLSRAVEVAVHLSHLLIHIFFEFQSVLLISHTYDEAGRVHNYYVGQRSCGCACKAF